MQELLNQLLESAKKDIHELRNLKGVAVKNRQYELAAQIRDIEKELFPETDEIKAHKKRAQDLNLLFRMADMNIEEKTCWLIGELISEHKKKKGKFSIDDAVRIRCKAREIFPD